MLELVFVWFRDKTANSLDAVRVGAGVDFQVYVDGPHDFVSRRVEVQGAVGDDRVGPEDGRVRQIVAADVEEPRYLVQGGDDERVGRRELHFLPDHPDFLLPRFAGVLVRQRIRRVRIVLRPAHLPDQVHQVVTDRDQSYGRIRWTRIGSLVARRKVGRGLLRPRFAADIIFE